MVLRWLVVALAAVDGKKRERHGADVASWAYSAAFLTRAVFLKSEVAEKRLFEGAANMEGASAMFRKNRLLKPSTCSTSSSSTSPERAALRGRRDSKGADAAAAQEWTYHDSAAVNPSGDDGVVVIMPYS
ncbi:hypothetical protein JL720_14756 [Aureococcus anophagefferens]|nr:hypothetical protein JL720_14756 [Aureococcus anophagefferens]